MSDHEWRARFSNAEIIESDDAAVKVLTDLAAELLPGWTVMVVPGGGWRQTAAVASPDARWESGPGQGGMDYGLAEGIQGNGIQKVLKAHALSEALLDAVRRQKAK
jgi:hypothetical protein